MLPGKPSFDIAQDSPTEMQCLVRVTDAILLNIRIDTSGRREEVA